MTIELRMLAWSVVLGLLHVVIAATCSVGQRGLPWAASPRDEIKPPLAGIGGRLDRARGNFLESFPLFAAVVLAGIALQRHDGITALGAQLYFWARVAYVPVYAAGIPYLRTLIWLVSIAGIVMLLIPLL
jgi:uncharacterized MAPEG superfamily protein